VICDAVWSGINVFPSPFYPTVSHRLIRRTVFFPLLRAVYSITLKTEAAGTSEVRKAQDSDSLRIVPSEQ
jgi:hypothetical protein